MRLAGFDFASAEQFQADLNNYANSGAMTAAEPVAPPMAARPIYVDDAGNHFIGTPTSEGIVTKPYVPSRPVVKPGSGVPAEGGFVETQKPPATPPTPRSRPSNLSPNQNPSPSGGTPQGVKRPANLQPRSENVGGGNGGRPLKKIRPVTRPAGNVGGPSVPASPASPITRPAGLNGMPISPGKQPSAQPRPFGNRPSTNGGRPAPLEPGTVPGFPGSGQSFPGFDALPIGDDDFSDFVTTPGFNPNAQMPDMPAGGSAAPDMMDIMMGVMHGLPPEIAQGWLTQAATQAITGAAPGGVLDSILNQLGVQNPLASGPIAGALQAALSKAGLSELGSLLPGIGGAITGGSTADMADALGALGINSALEAAGLDGIPGADLLADYLGDKAGEMLQNAFLGDLDSIADAFDGLTDNPFGEGGAFDFDLGDLKTKGIDQITGQLLSQWKVDDESSAMEHIAHAAVKKYKDQIKKALGDPSKFLKNTKSFFAGEPLALNFPVVRMFDADCYADIVSMGVATILVQGQPVARITDTMLGPMAPAPAPILQGRADVTSAGLPTAFMTATTAAASSILIQGAPTVWFGSPGTVLSIPDPSQPPPVTANNAPAAPDAPATSSTGGGGCWGTGDVQGAIGDSDGETPGMPGVDDGCFGGNSPDECDPEMAEMGGMGEGCFGDGEAPNSQGSSEAEQETLLSENSQSNQPVGKTPDFNPNSVVEASSGNMATNVTPDATEADSGTVAMPIREGGLLGGDKAEIRQGPQITEHLGGAIEERDYGNGRKVYDAFGLEVDTGPTGPEGCGSDNSGFIPDRIGSVDMRNACDNHDNAPGWKTPGTFSDMVDSNVKLKHDIIKDNPGIGGVILGNLYGQGLDFVAAKTKAVEAAKEVANSVGEALTKFQNSDAAEQSEETEIARPPRPGEITYSKPHINDTDPNGFGAIRH